MPDKALTPSAVLREQRILASRYRDPLPVMQDYVQGFSQVHATMARGEFMFYPWRPWQSLDHARRFANAVGRDIFMGPAYQVTAAMVDVLTGIAEKTAEMGVMEHVDAADLPSEYGFLWYDKPLMMTDRTGGQISIRAMSWGPQSVMADVTDGFGRKTRSEVATGCRLVLWSHLDDPTGYDPPGQPREVYGDLQMNHPFTFAFGERFPVKPKATGDSIFHLAHLTWVLLGSEITAQHRPRIEGKSLRRARGKLKHDHVTVVTLRRAMAEATDEHGHRVVDWSCCWAVQGFWRHLEDYDRVRWPDHRAVGDHQPGEVSHCTICGARCTWVRPHIRGPEWLPLKRSEKLFRLSR